MAPPTNTPYAVLTIGRAPRSIEDAATALLFAAGADGVAEDLPFVQKDLRYDPDVVVTGEMTLKAYFATPLSEQERLVLETELRSLHSGLVLSQTLEEHKDWLEEWKKGFAPFCFAEPFWIVPRWCEIPAALQASPEAVLLMEPGMAFGTGTHETTKLAAAMIVEWLQRRSPVAPQVLDVGTGTGILALIGERLGAKNAVGLDIDPEARRTARENLALNRAQRTVIDDRDLDRFAEAHAGQFDLVIANIIDGVLLTLAKDLRLALKPSGTLVLSGILSDRADEFHRQFAELSGLRECPGERTAMGEWIASRWVL